MSTGSDSKLSKLKDKLNSITHQIDEADGRKGDAKASSVEACARLEKAQSEKQSNERRICMLKIDLQEATKRMEEVEDTLQRTQTDSNSIEESRKNLEENEAEGDEKLGTLEEEAKTAKQELEANETKLREAERKLVVVKRDLVKTTEKADAMEKRVEVLEETISKANKSLKELEESENISMGKETTNEDKMVYLSGQYKEAEVRREAAQRSANVLEENIRQIRSEIDTWNNKIDEINKEFDEMNDADTSDEED